MVIYWMLKRWYSKYNCYHHQASCPQITNIITWEYLFQPKIVETLIGKQVIKVSCGAMHVMAVTGISYLITE
jgi:hypothetical protein